MTALATIQNRAPGFQPDIAVVLGSGWGGLTAADVARVDSARIWLRPAYRTSPAK